MNKLWESEWTPNESIVGRKGSEYFWARIYSSSCARLKWPGKDALLYPQHWRSLKYRPIFLNPSFGWKLQAERKKLPSKIQGLGLCLNANISLPQGREPLHPIPLYRQSCRDRLQSLVQVKPSSLRFWSTLKHTVQICKVIFPSLHLAEILAEGNLAVSSLPGWTPWKYKYLAVA